MRFTAAALAERGLPKERIYVSMERSMHCAIGLCGHCQLRTCSSARTGRCSRSTPSNHCSGCASCDRDRVRKPTLAVWKFASCDGCQLSMLDLEDELLALAGEIEIAYFLEARRQTIDGPYDLSLVEGSVTTPEDAERIQMVREQSRRLVTIGACATSGGIQALRNFADVDDFLSVVYASPEYVSTLDTSTPISDHVHVDFELQGCPINKRQLLEVISAFLNERRPGDLVEQRLHGVQAPRQRVRDGRARHALPRARHPRRLRRALPLLRPRLLRLLRADGDAQHGRRCPAG